MCFTTAVVHAQDPTGAIRGRVTTHAGAPLAGVRIVAQSPQLTLDRALLSGEHGEFVLELLPAGEYIVTFSSEKFVTVRHVTRLSALETLSVDIAMTAAQAPADDDELIRVSIDTARFPQPPVRVELTRQARLDWLPLEGSLFGVTTRAPGSIGSRTADAAVAVDGAPVRFFNTAVDRPLMNPGPSALADVAIVLAAVPADITQMRSGALSVVPQRGGDRVTGIMNATVGNAGRSADSPYDARETRGMGGGFDVGMGVPLSGRRTWLYGAATGSIDRLSSHAHLSRARFDERSGDRFWDLQVNHAFNPRHRLRAGLIRGARDVSGALPIGATSIEEAGAADSRSHAHGLISATYDAQAGASSYVTARVTSERWRAETGDRVAALPAVWDRQTGAVASATGACAGCELDDRTAIGWNVSLRRPGHFAGFHVFTVGAAQGFGRIDPPAASPAGSADLLASRFLVENGQVFPVLEPNGSSWIVLRAGDPDALSHGSQGFFVSDDWRPGPAVTVRAGLRWDRQRLSIRDGARPELVRSGFSPRVHVAWQPNPRAWTVSGGFSRYEADLLHVVGESLAPWGDWYRYQGPALNAAGSARDDSVAAAARAAELTALLVPRFTGSDAMWAALVSKSASALAPTVEWSVGAGGELMHGMDLRADFIWQRTRPLDPDANPAIAGPTDFTALSFERPSAVDLGLLTRRYTALVLQGNYDLGIQASVGGRYTLSRLTGVLDERAAASPVASWASPAGDLPGDRRHRLSVWGQVAPIDSESRGTLGLIVTHTIESGAPFGTAAWIDVAPWLAGPQAAPVLMPYYFTARDASRSDSISRTDFAIRYARRLPSTVRTDFVVQFHVLNMWNARDVLDPASFAAARTAFTHPAQFAPFNPLTEQPQQGTHWDVDPRLSAALGTAERTMPRAYRIVAGIRF